MQTYSLSAAVPWRRAAAYLCAIVCTPCVLSAQLTTANGKLQVAACDRELYDHVTAVTTNHSSRMIISPAPPLGILNAL